MKRKLAGIFVLLFSTLLMLTAMNQLFINGIKQDRYFDHLHAPLQENKIYHRVFIRSDRWRFGDLYGLCYLPGFKHPLEPFKQYQHPAGYIPQNRVLYIIGDSFLADKVLSGAFQGFDKVVYLDRRFPIGRVATDPSKQNYLLLEFAERNLNDFAFTAADQSPWGPADKIPEDVYRPVQLPERLGRIIFNKDLSRNIELLLFDDRFYTPLKEFKAWLNYALFGRTATEVAVSSDERRLFLNQSVDTASRQSAFRPLPDREADHIAQELAKSAAFYHSVGFKQTFLAVIPNAVSIYDPNRSAYNHLLEKIEKRSVMPVISVYRTYRSSKINLYYTSDAHWNPEGMDLWIKACNRQINLK